MLFGISAGFNSEVAGSARVMSMPWRELPGPTSIDVGCYLTAAATIGFAHVGTSAMSHIAAIFPSTT
jgi:hypothetical protein